MTEVQGHPQESTQIPSAPPFALFVGPDGPDEMDVDLADDDEDEDHDRGDDDDDDDDQGDNDDRLAADTIVEGAEYLGAYPSLEAYFRAMLEPEVSPGCLWLLDTVDWAEVQRRWESDGSRLLISHGQVYRVGGSAQPDPDDGDPCGPWMPTRGG